MHQSNQLDVSTILANHKKAMVLVLNGHLTVCARCFCTRSHVSGCFCFTNSFWGRGELRIHQRRTTPLLLTTLSDMFLLVVHYINHHMPCLTVVLLVESAKSARASYKDLARLHRRTPRTKQAPQEMLFCTMYSAACISLMYACIELFAFA